MIRKATFNDINKVLNIYEKIIKKEENNVRYTRWVLHEYPNYDTAQQAIADGEMFIMEDNEDVIATVILNDIQPDEYYDLMWQVYAAPKEVLAIHTLAINPDYSNKGYGNMLLNFVFDYAKSLGCKAVRLDTSETNTPAQNFYEKMHFKYISSIDLNAQGIIYRDLRCYEYVLGE